MTRLSASTVFLILSAVAPFLGSTIWVVGAVYYVLSVHMNPLELVLAGTALEVSYFLFQIPTGVFADTHSRRRSLVIGVLINGSCWLLIGCVPLFAAILAAEAVRGLGEAFIDGAESAWLADEVGEERFGALMLRGSQMSQMGGMAGTVAGVALASIRLNLPIALGGGLLLAVGIFIHFAMPEEGFKPVRHAALSRRAAFRTTLHRSVRLVGSSPLLWTILATALVFGAFSEGFDRLWEAHFLRDFSFPHLHGLKPIVWFAIINLGTGFLNMGLTEVVRRKVDMRSHVAVTRTMLLTNGILAASVITFGLAGSFGLALGAFAVAGMMRNLRHPLSTAWLNQNVTDSSIRATVLSMSGGADALGQFAGGPAIGVVGTAISLRAALAAAGALLLPALPLFGLALRQDSVEREPVGAAAAENAG